jgi:hypothetical protein
MALTALTLPRSSCRNSLKFNAPMDRSNIAPSSFFNASAPFGGRTLDAGRLMELYRGGCGEGLSQSI